MSEQNRLCALKVRVARKNHVGIFFGGIDERGLKFDNQPLNKANVAAHVKMSIERDLVIATSCRMKSTARRAD